MPQCVLLQITMLRRRSQVTSSVTCSYSDPGPSVGYAVTAAIPGGRVPCVHQATVTAFDL
eukprot:94200-Rhodomonas_salina.1